jgi:hypothetical protein
MPVTLKCPDCGHTKQAEDDKPQTCPQCDGTMRKPAYKAKSTPDAPPKAKPKAKPEDEEAPKAKKPARPAARPARSDETPLSLDDDDEGESGVGSTRDGKAAESLGIATGFKNRKLMQQVEEELSRGEVLHWAGRMCPEIAERKAKVARLGGIGFAALGLVIMGVAFALAPWYVGVILLLFPAVGTLIAVLGPRSVLKQAELGWYAVTSTRAIAYTANVFGKGGRSETYEPADLRKIRVERSSRVEGAGDLIFRTEVHDNRTKWVDKRTGRTVKTTGSRQVQHFGFLGIENVREVETLIHNILLGGDTDRDDEDVADDD